MTSDATTVAAAIALSMGLIKIIEKLLDKFSEKKRDEKGTSQSAILAKILEILDRMDRRDERVGEIVMAEDDEGRPKVWFPEATIRRTHEAVRSTLEASHEIAKGLAQNTENLKVQSTVLTELKALAGKGKGI